MYLRAWRSVKVSFNSRLREEATIRRFALLFRVPVSTHASVRRRPADHQRRSRGTPRFNSRLREEATVAGGVEAEAQAGFNSRLREEATSSATPFASGSGSFQLTPP